MKGTARWSFQIRRNSFKTEGLQWRSCWGKEGSSLWGEDENEFTGVLLVLKY